MADRPEGLYLGGVLDPATGAPTSQPLILDPDDLTTHAVCFGMTGSGKTGLCIVLLEEAIRRGIPVFAIDPKGDVANLMLAFPSLEPKEFEPWIDPERARAAGTTPARMAVTEASRWREGLASWGLGPADVAALKRSAEMTVFTPGSTAGAPINVLGGFTPPDKGGWDLDPESLRSRIGGTVAGLLDLVGMEVDPVRGPEGIFLARLFELRWRAGATVTLESIVRELLDPTEPMRTLGAIDTESMLPRARRSQVAMAVNTLLASPSFAPWAMGEPLDVARLARSADGALPRVSIFHLTHLPDRERVFFVSIFLQSLIAWMRTQPGTGSLKALFFMDEIFGYLPPVGEPPTKQPLLALLKQARASGLGAVLATQNPVDVDYKGLSNAGTWFLGKLQTEQDRRRLLDGLSGAGGYDRPAVERALASLPPRAFILHSVRAPALRVFTTRWAMSWLRGPLTRDEIRRLAGRASPAAPPAAAAAPAGRPVRESLPAGTPEWFAPSAAGTRLVPALRARVRIVYPGPSPEAREEDLCLAPGREWDASVPAPAGLTVSPPDGVVYADLPDVLRTAAGWRQAAASLKSHLALTRASVRWTNRSMKVTSMPGETAAEFRQRCRDEAASRRGLEERELGARLDEKVRRLEARVQKEDHDVRRDRQEVEGRKADEVVNAGEALLGLFLGRRRRSLSGVMGKRRMTAGSQERLARSEAERQAAMEEVRRARDESARKLADLAARWEAAAGDIVETPVAAGKSGIEVLELGLLWTPELSS